MTQGNFLPLTMNLTIYRIGFLLRVLSSRDLAKLQSLSAVEQYFKDRTNWQNILQALPRKLGYINMHFGGVRAEERADWQNKPGQPNDETR